VKVSIIGYGEMAKAIAEAIKDDYSLEIVGRNEEKLKKLAKDINCEYKTFDNFDATGKIVILAVKPYALNEVAQKIKGKSKIIISILAGKTIKELKEKLNSEYFVRAMPNIAAKFAKSTTACVGDDEAKKEADNILSKIGKVIWLNNDDEIDIATAIIGSGPAFLAIIAEAISDSGVYLGLKREISEELTKGLFESFSSLPEDFAIIRKKIMSPGGTTAEGVRVLEEEAIRGKIMKGLIKTYEKAKKL